jgi:hypothetical protein
MLRSTRIISLVLVGTASAFLGYEALSPSEGDSAGEDFADQVDANGNSLSPTTGPSSHGTGYAHSHYHRAIPWYFGGGFGSYRGTGSHSSSGSSGTSGTHSGTSRGGFGHSGHASGS